jgi:hypothetical protein
MTSSALSWWHANREAFNHNVHKCKDPEELDRYCQTCVEYLKTLDLPESDRQICRALIYEVALSIKYILAAQRSTSVFAESKTPPSVQQVALQPTSDMSPTRSYPFGTVPLAPSIVYIEIPAYEKNRVEALIKNRNRVLAESLEDRPGKGKIKYRIVDAPFRQV